VQWQIFLLTPLQLTDDLGGALESSRVGTTELPKENYQEHRSKCG
jgi:hypothetical protein